MANHQLRISKFYIENSKMMDEKYPNNNDRFIMNDADGNICELKMSIVTMIKLFHQNNLFEPISIEDQLKIAIKFNKYILDDPNDIIDECFREKIVKLPNSKQIQSYVKLKHYDGYKLFCEHLKPSQVNQYYKKLQTIIDSLGIDIDVKGFTSYPSLMEAIMYKYGCFDNVYELAAPLAQKIREKLVFPVPHTYNHKPFYSNKKLYYIDINGAYLSCIDSIPAGKCDSNLEFTEKNAKIKELIEKMYKIRMDLKHKDSILYKMFKQLMTCCWGMSIKRGKIFTKDKPKNVDEYVNQNLPYVVEVNKDFVKTISSISVNYSYPQFARQVLQNFQTKINSVLDIVDKVYYYNIDALLIDEESYKKVVNAGLIGDELGMFKIEHIFTEIAIKSSRVYVATLDDGTKYYHTGNRTVDYNDFVMEVCSSPGTTVLI